MNADGTINRAALPVIINPDDMRALEQALRLKEQYPYRIMEAQWRNNADGSFRATISIVAHDIPGVANQITEVITRELKLNIRGLNFSSRADGTAYGTVSVEVSSATIVDTLIHSLMRVKGVQRAYRVNN